MDDLSRAATPSQDRCRERQGLEGEETGLSAGLSSVVVVLVVNRSLVSPQALASVVLALALTLSWAPAATSESGAVELLVGFNGPVDATRIALAGGSTLRVLPEIGVAVVSAANPAAFAAAALTDPGVSFVETNDLLLAAGASPDSSTWDSSTWDSSTWDSSTWDSSTWDSSTWDSTIWDSSTWDSSTWDSSTWDSSTWDGDWGTRDAGWGVQWGLGAVDAPTAWAVTAGDAARKVCVLDTGIDSTHPDLAGRLWQAPDGRYGVNAVRGGAPDPLDATGHGTHVAGILAAGGGNGIGVAGMTRALIMNVKVMDAAGGRESDLAAGLTLCRTHGASIATMSLHVTERSRTLERAVDHARESGMILVAAAGNTGGAIGWPAAAPGVLAVGAVTPSGAVAGFSSRGPDLDLVAPGWRIASTALRGGYAIGSGTSQAAPFVAGAAALVWSANPALSASAVEDLLLATAKDLGAPGRDDASGAGALDAGQAVLAAAAP